MVSTDRHIISDIVWRKCIASCPSAKIGKLEHCEGLGLHEMDFLTIQDSDRSFIYYIIDWSSLVAYGLRVFGGGVGFLLRCVKSRWTTFDYVVSCILNMCWIIYYLIFDLILHLELGGAMIEGDPLNVWVK